MALIITAISIVYLFAAFIVIGALSGMIVGSMLISLTVTLIVLGASLLISSITAGILSLIFRIREGAYGR